MSDMLAPYRHRRESRFTHQNDWLRLSILGIIVISFGAIGLADSWVPILDHFGCSPALFGGLAIAPFIQKISRAKVYLDWMLNAAFYFGVGYVFYGGETLNYNLSFVVACALLFASGWSRIWIGTMAEPGGVASWMLSSGCIALLGVFWIVGARVLSVATTPSTIVALDCIFQGISIVGFGLSLKKAH